MPETDGSTRFLDMAGGESRPADVLALAAQELLQTYCGECHGVGAQGAASNGALDWGFDGALDWGRLTDSGLIVPGSSGSSPLLVRLLDGRVQSPGHPGTITRGDIGVIADFIDQLPSAPAPACEPAPWMGVDATYAALLEDIRARPEADRPYLRYLGVADASNAGRCGAALDERRLALFKLINGVSVAAAIRLPVAVDAAGLLFRIDIRDYGWDHAIDLAGDGSIDAADGWAALLLAAYPSAVELSGPQASELVRQTGTPVPFMSVGAFVRAASESAVYRALLGMGADLDDWLSANGVDLDRPFAEGRVARAGIDRRPFSFPWGQVLATRVTFGATGERAYWWLDVDDEPADGGSIFSEWGATHPGEWNRNILELPNGLHAYGLHERYGEPIAEAGRGCDHVTCRSATSRTRRPASHPVACMGCHAGGLRPIDDEVRAVIEAESIFLGPEELAFGRAAFVPAVELQPVVDADNARYRAALAQLGIPSGAPDPVSRTYLDVDNPVDLQRAAAELGILPLSMLQRLGSLPAELSPLAEPAGVVERPVFEAARAAALCGLDTQNRPVSCP